jgi:hypothetical protein
MENLVKSITKYGKTFYKNITEGGCQEWVLSQQKHPNEICITINNGEHCRLWGNIKNTEVLDLIQTNKYMLEILHHYPYKVAFDYDLIDIDKIENFNEKEQLNKVLNLLNQYFLNAIYAVSGSICFIKNKFSLHIVLNNYLITNDKDRERIKILSTYFKNIDNGFDNSIYGRSRQMKLINQTKPNDNRVQKIILNNDPKHHIITSFFTEKTFDIPDFSTGNFNDDVKQRFHIEKTKKPFNINSIPDLDIEIPENLKDIELNELTTEQILKLLPLDKSFGFEYIHFVARYCYYNNIDFDTYLCWLKRKNPVLQKTDQGIKMWDNLNKYPPVYINNIIPVLDKYYKNLTTDKCLRKFKNLFNLNVNRTKINKIEPIHFRGDEKYSLFNCGMGSGKTTQTINFLKTEQNFLWVAPNIALAENTLTRLESENIECSNYLKFKPKDKKNGILNEQIALMVCLNSLAYINTAHYRVVVIDEIETILEKFFGDDNMVLNCRNIWENFIRLLKNANKVIILDAFITNTTLDLLNSILLTGETIKLYETPIISNRQVNYIDDFTQSIKNIVDKLNAGNKLFIYYPLKKNKQTTTTFYSSMEDFYNEIIKQTKKTGMMYNADIDDKIKNTIKICNDEWVKQDFIITNNVITCGVNFDKKHFDEVFIFVANFSLPRQIIQVSYRARILNAEIINIAYLGDMKKQSGYKINENIQDPIYKQLINNVLIERKAPIRQAIEYFCKTAGYKQEFLKTETSSELLNFYDEFTKNRTKIFYSDIETITNENDLEFYKNMILDRNATQKIKLMVKKYHYDQLFKSETELDNEKDKKELEYLKCDVWDNGLFGFIKGIQNLHHNKFIENIFELNKDSKEFKNGLFPTELKNPKLDKSIIDDIFNKFKFKDLTKSSKPNKLYMEAINTYFKCEIIQSEYDIVSKRSNYIMNTAIDFNSYKNKLDKYLSNATFGLKQIPQKVEPCKPNCEIKIIPIIPDLPKTKTALDKWININ